MTTWSEATEKFKEPRGSGSRCSPLDEGYLTRHVGEMDGRTARFILNMAIRTKVAWFNENTELTNRLLAAAQSDRPDWLPEDKKESRV